MPEITATVVAKSEYGIKVEQDGDWWNWSKPEYRGEPFNTEVQKGDRVQITYAQTDGGKTYITTIGKVTSVTAAVQSLSPDAVAELIEEFPPDDVGLPLDPVIDTNHSIVRQTCIKAASVALQHNMGSAEEKAGMVTYLAGVLEDWCWR